MSRRAGGRNQEKLTSTILATGKRLAKACAGVGAICAVCYLPKMAQALVTRMIEHNAAQLEGPS